MENLLPFIILPIDKNGARSYPQPNNFQFSMANFQRIINFKIFKQKQRVEN